MPRRPPARLVRALVVGLLAAGLAGGLALIHGGPEERVEQSLVDARFAVRGEHTLPNVVVVAIDQPTFGRLPYRWPYPRWIHALAIRRLLRAGAREVAYDVQFSERSNARDDRELLAAASDRRVVLSTTEVDADHEPAVIGRKQLVAGGGRVGMALFPVDRDGVWRRLQGRIAGVPQLSVLAADGDPSVSARPIDFAGPAGTARRVSFWRVASGRFDPRAVQGRIVVVGATTPALLDLHPVAVGGDLMPGPEIHANAIQTVLDGYPLRDTPTVVAILLVLLAGLLAPLATLAGSPSRALAQALGAGLLGTLALLGGAQLAFDAGAIVPVAAPLLALALGTVGAVALTYVFEVRARQRLRTTFERFVPPKVAAELLPEGDAAPRLESRRLEATVLFCDLRGFTMLSERLEAEQVIAVLNRYLEGVSAAVFAHGGTVVSYQGDGVMAVFGAPLPQSDHAARALAAAREILDDALPRFNARLMEERLADAPLDAGIGLNTGHVMSGLVGSERRVEYAAVGDATNVAARLQGLGRDAEGRLFVSGTTYTALAAAGTVDGLRRHGEVDLRGRREPVTVYVAD
ncbi:MAG: CHASE2 domain-containing protein [Conexibacter sp.]